MEVKTAAFLVGEEGFNAKAFLGTPNHPNDKQEAAPTLNALSCEVGKPKAAALDNGYLSEGTIRACEQRGIEPYIATSREVHHLDWHTFFEQPPDAPLTRQSEREDGLQASNRDRQRHLSFAQVDRRTGDRHNQGGAGLSPIFAAWLTGRG